MKLFNHNGVSCILSKDGGKWHLSMSCPDRLPTYEEMKEIRYKYLPTVAYMAQIFPPLEEFVNVHPFTLHLWQVGKSEIKP
jgi:hypothetical protein